MVVQLCSAVHPQALLPKQNGGLEAWEEVREHRGVVLLVLMNTPDSSQ